MKKFVFVIPLMAIFLLASCGPKPINTYTVTFNSNGGSSIDSLTVTKGEVINRPTNPVKANMTFYNWYTNERFESGPYDFNTPVVGDLVLYARWGYRVTFYNSDATIYHEQVTPESTTVEPPPSPSVEYYDFAGWYTDASCEEEYLYEFDEVIESDLSLYSKFTAKKYDIIYHDLITGDINPNPESYIYGVGVDELKDVTRDNYIFVGWFTDSEHKNPITSISKDAHGVIDLYPKFIDIFKITYPNWPEDIPNPNPTEYSQLSEIITFDTTIFDDEKYEGHLHFKNYLDEDKNPITEIPSGSVGNRTIYLDYDADEVTIDFDANGGSLDEETFNNVYLDYCQEDTENVEITGVPQVSQSESGYNPNTADHLDRGDKYFAGWYLDEDYTQPLVESDSTINEVQPGDTLYAKWNEKIGDYCTIANKQGATINFRKTVLGRDPSVDHDFYAHVPFYASQLDVYIEQETTPLSLTSLVIFCKVDNTEIFRTGDMSKWSFSFSHSIAPNFVVESCLVSYYSGVHIIGSVPHTCGASVTFTTSEGCYRNQLVKVKSDKGSKKVKYWDLVNVGEPSRDGYRFAGWSIDGMTPIDLGKHYQFNADTQLKALWKPIA